MTTLNKYIVTFSDNGEQFEVQAESLVALTPLIQQFNRQGRGCKINRAVENETVQEPTTTKEKEMKKFIIAGTGSRELVKDHKEWRKVVDYLIDLLYKAHQKHGDNLLVVSGMAEGFDEALAMAAYGCQLPLLAAIPNKGYSKYYWQNNSLTGEDRMSDFQNLAKYAHTTGGVHYVCDGIYGPDGRHSNFHRNEWMVDQADIVWVYNPTTRGTAQCYAYCKKVGKRTFIINPNKGE